MSAVLFGRDMAVWKRQCSSDSDDFVLIDLPEDEKIIQCCDDKKDPWHPEILDTSWKPLTKEEFDQLFDNEGRLVDEHQLRKAVFRGGVDPDIRKEVWRFLFGLFPFHSTQRERETLLVEHYLRYKARKRHCWNLMSKLNFKEFKILLSDTSGCSDSNKFHLYCCYPTSDNMPSITEEDEKKINFIKLLAEVDAQRHNIDLEKLTSDIRIINKDVPRTDRDHQYFSGENNPHLEIVQNILITFSAFYPEIGYVQGMNDILSRFLVVLDAEDEAYWCFVKYIENTQKDYSAEGMKKKLDLLSHLLEKTDPDLYYYLVASEIGVTFCHRWLLVGFKREFCFNDGLRLFEVLSSHYLEMNSIETLRAKQFSEMNMKQAGRLIHFEEPSINVDLTFDLFVCMAFLICNRKRILLTKDSVLLCQLINNVTKGADLEEMLSSASRLFFQYCKRTVVESFLVKQEKQKRKLI